jgi:hypothetical protein
MTHTADERALRRLAGAGGLPPARDLLLLTATLHLLADTTIGDGTESDSLADTVVRRDPGTAIDPAARTVRPGGLFTEEVLSAGTRLPLLWEVWLQADDPGRTRRILELTLLAGALLDAGEIRVGRRTNAGRGVVRTGGWAGRWFALSSRESDAAAWYRVPYDRKSELVRDHTRHDTALAALEDIRNRTPGTALPSPLAPPDLAVPDRLTITGILRIEERIGAHTVAATAAATPAPAGAVLDSGPAVKALLRATATRAVEFIATGAGTVPAWDVAAARDRGRALVLDLFGPHPSDGIDTPAAATLQGQSLRPHRPCPRLLVRPGDEPSSPQPFCEFTDPHVDAAELVRSRAAAVGQPVAALSDVEQ